MLTTHDVALTPYPDRADGPEVTPAPGLVAGSIPSGALLGSTWQPGACMSRQRGHRVVPHTADVIIEAWAPDLAGCFEEAVAAMVGICARIDGAAALVERPVRVPPGPEDVQLLDLLDEVIFALDTAEGIPVAATVGQGDDGALDGVLWLAPPDRVEAVGSVPKAVSHTELNVRRAFDGVTCRFLVDV